MYHSFHHSGGLTNHKIKSWGGESHADQAREATCCLNCVRLKASQFPFALFLQEVRRGVGFFFFFWWWGDGGEELAEEGAFKSKGIPGPGELEQGMFDLGTFGLECQADFREGT